METKGWHTGRNKCVLKMVASQPETIYSRWPFRKTWNIAGTREIRAKM